MDKVRETGNETVSVGVIKQPVPAFFFFEQTFKNWDSRNPQIHYVTSQTYLEYQT